MTPSSVSLVGDVVQPVPEGPCTARVPCAHADGVSVAPACAGTAVPVWGVTDASVGIAVATGAPIASAASATMMIRVMWVIPTLLVGSPVSEPP